MGSQALEQILRSAPLRSIEQSNLNQTIDSYANNTTALYSFDVGPINNLRIEPIQTPWARPLEPLRDEKLLRDYPLIDNTKGLYTPNIEIEKPGTLSEQYGPLIERIDAAGSNPVLKYDLYGVKKKQQKDLFGTKKDYNDFHHIKL